MHAVNLVLASILAVGLVACSDKSTPASSAAQTSPSGGQPAGAGSPMAQSADPLADDTDKLNAQLAASPLLKDVQTFPSEGRTHVPPGQRVIYRTNPPLSGSHDPVATPPGFYTEPQRPEQLVHSLEHGNIVIYYDPATPENLEKLKKIAALFPGAWDGVVVVPSTEPLGDDLIVTAWRRMLRLDSYDGDKIAAFIDLFHGRGPENPVR